jgi:hypothetical protein
MPTFISAEENVNEDKKSLSAGRLPRGISGYFIDSASLPRSRYYNK